MKFKIHFASVPIFIAVLFVLFSPASVGALPAIGTIWQRSNDWSIPPSSDFGTTNGNPSADAQGNVVWQYESVPLGQSLGEPTTNGQPSTAWCNGTSTKLTWDNAWYGGAGGWSGGDDVSPLVQQTTVYQALDNSRVPMVRWSNPTSTNLTLSVSGILTLGWSSTSLTQPIDFVLMLQRADGSTTPLVIANRKPPSYIAGTPPPPSILIDLPALQIPAGGSIFYTLRYESAQPASGYVTLDDSNLRMTLRAFGAVPLLSDDTAVTDINEPVNIEVLANDHWAPQTLPRGSVVTPPAHGSAVVRMDQSIDYFPATNFIGTDSFTYQVFDGAGSNIASVAVTVNQPYYLYVSPGGNDANSGASWTNALATIEGARNSIRTLRTQSNNPLAASAVEVVLDDRTYMTDHTLQFAANDSGTPQFPVTYRARHPLQSAISGARILNLTWQACATNPGAYVADLSGTGLSQAQLNNVRTLIVNGTRATRARLPAGGFYTVVSANPNISDAFNKMNSFTFGTSNGQPNIKATWPNLTNVEVISYAAWTESRMPIGSVDAANQQMHIQGSLEFPWANDYLADYGAFLEPTAPFNQTGATDGTIRYYLENVLEGVNAPGMWYLDPIAGKLYYHPQASEVISNSTFAVPLVNQLLQITGASNLRFDGITFCDTDWTMPATGQPGEDEAIFFTTPNAVAVSSATNVVFANGRFTRNGGGFGLQFQFGATGNAIINTEFDGNGGGGLMIGGIAGYSDPTAENGHQSYAASNRASLNFIHDNNLVWREAPGILTLRNGYNRIAGNIISNVTYSGISSGWFDTDPLAAGHNQIVWNTIKNFGTVLYDIGGIYVVGSQPYTMIMGNTISDGLWTTNDLHRGGIHYPSDGANVWNNPGGPRAGIYTDDTSRGEWIIGNTLNRVNQGIFIHDSCDQLYLDNILVNTQPDTWGAIYVGNDANNLDAGACWIGSSVFAWTATNPAATIFFDSYAPLPSFVMDRDIYLFGPVTMQTPQSNGLPYLLSTGHEAHSVVITNTLFVSPSNDDFRISTSAQALLSSQGFIADWLFEPAISATPVAQFGAGPKLTGFAPLTVSFTNLTSGETTNYLWNFGDGHTLVVSSLANVTNVYSMPGAYSVTLVVTGTGGSSTTTITNLINVFAPPTIISGITTNGYLVMRGSNCPPGNSYRVLTATNLSTPLINWLPVMTNVFASDGEFLFTNTNLISPAFFRLVSP